MKAFPSVLSVPLFSLGAFAATITLYEVAVPQPTSTALPFVSEGASFTISPIGVGEDGKTTYVEEEVLTEAVAVFSDSTTTIIPPSSAFTYTIVEEDASGLLRQASSGNPAVPSQHEALNLPGLALTTTYSGSLIPAYTLTKTASIPGLTGKSGALTQNNISDASHLIGLLFVVWATLLVA